MDKIYVEKVKELAEILLQMRKAFPNGYDQLKWEAQRLFEELIDLPNED